MGRTKQNKMNDTIRNIISQYRRKEFNKEEFLEKIQPEIGNTKEDFKNQFEKIILAKNVDDLKYGLIILYAIEESNEMIHLIHRLILEPWHGEYEEIAHDLQKRAQPESIPFLKEAMQKKYKYLESYGTGTRQFINQCGHALWSIGTKEAIEVIQELSKSNDPVVKDEMMYRINRIEGKDDYERND